MSNARRRTTKQQEKQGRGVLGGRGGDCIIVPGGMPEQKGKEGRYKRGKVRWKRTAGRPRSPPPLCLLLFLMVGVDFETLPPPSPHLSPTTIEPISRPPSLPFHADRSPWIALLLFGAKCRRNKGGGKNGGGKELESYCGDRETFPLFSRW